VTEYEVSHSLNKIGDIFCQCFGCLWRVIIRKVALILVSGHAGVQGDAAAHRLTACAVIEVGQSKYRSA
jgi:hypothetical protein